MTDYYQRGQAIKYLRYLGRQLAWLRKNNIGGKESRPYGEMVRRIRSSVELLQHIGVLNCKYPKEF